MITVFRLICKNFALSLLALLVLTACSNNTQEEDAFARYCNEVMTKNLTGTEVDSCRRLAEVQAEIGKSNVLLEEKIKEVEIQREEIKRLITSNSDGALDIFKKLIAADYSFSTEYKCEILVTNASEQKFYMLKPREFEASKIYVKENFDIRIVGGVYKILDRKLNTEPISHMDFITEKSIQDKLGKEVFEESVNTMASAFESMNAYCLLIAEEGLR